MAVGPSVGAAEDMGIVVVFRITGSAFAHFLLPSFPRAEVICDQNIF